MFSTPVPEEMLRAAAEAAGYRHDRGVQQCVRDLYLDPDQADQEDIAELLRGFRVEAQLRGRDLHPFLPSPDSLPNGGVPVARIPHYRDLVRLPVSKHIYVAGRTGTGKTTLTELLLFFAHRVGMNLVVFDPEGQFVTDLIGNFAPEDVYVVDADSYLVNPFEPPHGLTQKEWSGILGNIDREVWYYRRGAENFATKVKLGLLEEGKELNLATFFDALSRYAPPQRNWREREYYLSVKTTTEALVTFLLALTVASSRGLAELFSRRLIVFDWSKLQNYQFKKFLTIHAVAWFLASRIGHNRPVDTMVVFDEVSQLASSELSRQIDIAEPFFLQILRTARRKGISVVTLDQNPSMTHQVVRANSSTKVVMTLDEGQDKRTIALDFDLTPEQRAFLSALRPRDAIFKLPDIPQPFLGRVLEVSFDGDTLPARFR